MSPTRVLGGCGLVASVLFAVDGGLGSPFRMVAGGIMAFANLYCLLRRCP